MRGRLAALLVLSCAVYLCGSISILGDNRLERTVIEFESPPVHDFQMHPAANQLDFEYTPRFVEKSEESKDNKPTPIAAATAKNGETTVQTVMTVNPKEGGGKKEAKPGKDAAHTLETVTTTTMRRVIKEKKEKKKCGKKEQNSQDANVDKTTIRITVTQEDEDCEAEDPLLASKKQQIENLDSELKRKRSIYSNEMKWLRSADGLLKELMFKTQNVKSHITLVTKELSIINARREQAQRELMDLERKKGAEQTLRVLEGELAQLISSAQNANDKMAQLAEKKGIYMQKIDEVRRVLENVKSTALNGPTTVQPGAPQQKAGNAKATLLI